MGWIVGGANELAEEELRAVDVDIQLVPVVSDGVGVGSSVVIVAMALEVSGCTVVTIEEELVWDTSEPEGVTVELVVDGGGFVEGLEVIDTKVEESRDNDVGAADGELATIVLEVAIVEGPAVESVRLELVAMEPVMEDWASDVGALDTGDGIPEAELCATELGLTIVIAVEVGVELGVVKDGGMTEDGSGLTTVTVEGLHFEHCTVVPGSSSVTVTVVGDGKIVIVSVVPIVLTTVTCALNADEAEAPAPPSTGTTDHVGLLARASR
ncbi:hypothetical protein MMC10_006975 [Thelotrema lepadinum]|nr:hypothetical protein [Thelotrema lepadinum]